MAARGVLTAREAAVAAFAAHLEDGLTIMSAGCVGGGKCRGESSVQVFNTDLRFNGMTSSISSRSS